MEHSLVQRATGTNLLDLPRCDRFLEEYDEGEITFGFDRPLTKEQLIQLKQELEGKIVLTGPIYQTYDPPQVIVPFRKEIAPLAIAALAVAGLGVGGFAFWKLSSLVITPRPGWAAGGIVAVLAGVAASAYGFKKPEGGKGYLYWVPGLMVTAGGVYVFVREFIPHKPYADETSYSISGDEAEYELGEGEGEEVEVA